MPWFNFCPVQDSNMNIAKNAGKRALASTAIRGKVLTIDTMNDRVKQVQYAVRGPIVIRAGEIETELKSGKKYPFDEVIKCNIGDAHAMGQNPITFLRQVVSGAAFPDLIESDNNNCVFPSDAVARTKRILDGCGGKSIGAYSNSAGVQVIREDIARFIEKRDGAPAGSVDPSNIMMSTGASGGIVAILKLLVTGPETGIMIPIPQYPLYSACLAELGATVIPYYLNEEKNWSLDIEELERSYAKAEAKPKAICIINPGNPTGQVLSHENIKKVLQFAYDHKLFVLADEVYQDNIYDPNCEFHSFRKVLMESDFASELELASFHSTSKGYMGECGFRSGYMEICNIDGDVKVQLTKLISSRLCPPVAGQAAMDVVVNPPQPNEESYAQFIEEKTSVLNALKNKAKLVADTFNAIDGVSCQTVQGAMYAFPQVKLPQKFIDEAKSKGEVPDAYYCSLLLEQTGICVVPGSGFRQKEGTFHFRTTILPPKEKMEKFAKLFTSFHTSISQKYA
jgi:alanine transaminase